MSSADPFVAAALAAAPPPVEEEPAEEVIDSGSLTGCCSIKDEHARASALVALCQQWESAVRHLWPAWHEAGGMVYGDQFGSYNAQMGVWQQRTPAPERKVTRLELNHMQPICADVASLQVQDLPNMRAAAPNETASAASASLAADQLVWWMWEQGNYDKKNLELREAAAVYGNAFLWPRWDPSGGRLVQQLKGYEPVPGPIDPMTGVPSSIANRPIYEMVREGCFEDRIVSCFAGIYDPCARDEWDGEGFVIHEQMSLTDAERNYPGHDFRTQASPSAQEGAFYENQLANLAPRIGGGMAKDDHAARKVDHWTIFVRTSDAFYRGRCVVIVDNKIVHEDDNPVYPSEEEEAKGEEFPAYHWPVWRFAHFTVAGSSYGQGVAIRMIGAQKKLNGIVSKVLHMLKRTSHPTLIKPSRAQFIKTDEPDQQINVPSDLPPNAIYYLDSPGIPQELPLEEQRAVEQMERIAGLHAGSRGQSESGDSGTKTRLLFQRDIGRLGPIKFGHDKQIGQAFAYKLREWRRRATTKRTIRIVGADKAISVRSMDSSNIAANTDIVVFSDAGLPRDPSQRMMHVEKAVQLGIVDPKDPIQRAGLAEVVGLAGTFRKWQATLYADRRCAEDENIRMYDGEVPTVEFWQDDLQHLAAHFAEMNTEDWRRATTPLPEDDPQTAMKKTQIRQIWIDHVKATQDSMKIKAGGAPPGAGPSPGALPVAPGGPPPMLGPGMGALPPPPPGAGGPPAQKVAA